MEQIPLREKYPRLLAFLKDRGYSKAYIRKFKTEIKVILHLKDRNEWGSYNDLFHRYRAMGYGPKYIVSKKSILGLIEQFDTKDMYPGGPGIYTHFGQEDPFGSLSSEFKQVLETYIATETDRGIKESTLHVSSLNMASLFRHLRSLDITILAQVEEKHILDFFYYDGQLKYGYSFKKNLKAVFKACSPHFKECSSIMSYLPALRETRKNIQYLTTEESKKIKEILPDYSNNLNYRDRAVGTLLMYTGLRSCDIAKLRLEDIRWKEDIITIAQQKTSVNLTLPLRAVVGNALYNYITKERPRNTENAVFLSETRPHRPIRPSVINTHIPGKIFDVAEIRQNKGERRGSHIFRHLLAITLLENDVPQPVITSTLGHTSPNSVETYLRADFAHLKQCGISIEKFPVRKEVFDE
jgi:integrase